MTLYERIESEMKEALKKREAEKVSILRMVIAAVRNAEILKKVKKLEEADVIQVIQKIIKEHKESIAQFEKGNRPDLVGKEQREMDMLKKYVPEEMGDAELSGIVKAAIQELGVTMKADAGKVMKAVMEKVKGKADGKTVNQIVMSLLK